MIHVDTHGLCKLSVLKKGFVFHSYHSLQSTRQYLYIFVWHIFPWSTNVTGQLHVHVYVKGRYSSKINVEGAEILVENFLNWRQNVLSCSLTWLIWSQLHSVLRADATRMVIVLSLTTRINSYNNKNFYQTIEITIMLSVEEQFTLLLSYTNYTHRMVFAFRWLLLSTKWFLCNIATYVARQWQDIILVIYMYICEPASQPALPETSGWLVLELMPTRAV